MLGGPSVTGEQRLLACLPFTRACARTHARTRACARAHTYSFCCTAHRKHMCTGSYFILSHDNLRWRKRLPLIFTSVALVLFLLDFVQVGECL